MSSTDESRRALVEVAEKLYATRGIDGVSLRDIAAAAGHRNNSAVQYHFGDRDGLLRAIFRSRMSAINDMRRDHLDELDRQGRGEDVRALVEAGIRPLTDFLASAPEATHYARFLARVSPSVDFFGDEFAALWDANAEIVRRLTRLLPHLSPRTAVERIDLVFNMSVSALAIFEQRQDDGIPVVRAGFDETVEHLIDMAVGALQAEDSHARLDH
ncbi:TetR/AcrR family transcriptional regulator [Rhodococcus ruber]|uniref:TetR/AcrR family transcriptional regulator n=1 Tax=Rhodococcus ruber TaxID=1830 RepID=UPI00315CD151